MPANEALRVCLEVARLFERLEIPYVVGGSLASSLHGIPRSTNDADLAAELREKDVRLLVQALEGRYYVDEDRVRDAITRKASFNVIELATMFKVDIFVLGSGPLDQEELARRKRFTLPESGDEIDIASAEDTILQKLHWYRLGRGVSDRQWQDLLGVLQVQGHRLDRNYLKHGAELLGVQDLLERALREGGLEGESGRRAGNDAGPPEP